jgi:GT2 family glycosyltransferase
MSHDVGKPAVSVIVTQRERLSAMAETLEALYASLPADAEVIYVTGMLRGKRKDWLAEQASQRGFRHVEAGRRLTPAEAKNFGATFARADYLAFIENDVVPREGWLEALVACAEETGAAVVAPVTCEGRPIHTIVHHVGEPVVNFDEFTETKFGKRDFKETLLLQGEKLAEVAPSLIRRPTQSTEFHCFLVRRSMFDKIGGLDPTIVSKEFFDFSWSVIQAGGTIWLEPQAVVTFLLPSDADPIKVTDLPYFLLRWSSRWQRVSHDALKAKWGFKEEGYIAERRALADWRVMDHVVKPTLRRVPVLGRKWGFVERAARLVYPALDAFGGSMARRHHAGRRRISGGGVDAS